MTEVEIYHLQMTGREQLRPATDSRGLNVIECRVPQFEVNRFLYQFIGGPWQWTDKLSWSDTQWREYAERPTLRTFIGYSEGSPAGYYELERQPDGDVELKYFGLAPAFIGKGLGGYLLSHAIDTAWEWPGTRRVWVHTCTLDHPAALANYKARGFQHYRTETARD